MQRLWSDYVFALLVKTGVLPRVFCLGRFASGQIPIELDRWSSTDGARPMELDRWSSSYLKLEPPCPRGG